MGTLKTTKPVKTLYSKLPNLLKETCDVAATKYERDLLLISTLGVLSGIIDCFGNYDNRKVRPNLFVLVIAPAASGKSIMNYALRIADAYNHSIKEKSKNDGKYKSLFIPANSSAASLYEALLINDGVGVIFETEIDTLTTALKQDWGNFSDVLRKGFQQERITQLRKSEPKIIELGQPRFSVVLSGTPGQLVPLIDSSENGLFSRFAFYNFSQAIKWRDVSPKRSKSLDQTFEELSKEYLLAFQHNCEFPFELNLSEEQWARLNSTFENWTSIAVSENPNLVSSIKRLGLISFKICMVLTMLRRYQTSRTDGIEICHEDDFSVSLILAAGLRWNAEVLLSSYSKISSSRNNPEIQFLHKLPNEFTRGEIVEKFGAEYSERTIDKYLSILDGNQLTKPKAGYYKKVNLN